MNCRGTRNRLPLHAGDDLAAAEAAAVQAHLQACPPCAREAERYAAARAELRAAVPASARPEPSLWASLEPRLAAVDAAARQRLPWYRRTAWWSAAAAVLVAGITVPLYWGGSDGPGPATGPAGNAAMSSGLVVNAGHGAQPGGLIPVPASELQRLLGSFVREGSTAPSPVVQASNRGRF